MTTVVSASVAVPTRVVTKRRKVNLADQTPIAVFTKDGILAMGHNSKGEMKILGIVPEDEFINQFNVNKPMTTGLIPAGTIYYERLSTDRGLFYILGCQKNPDKITYNFGYVNNEALQSFELCLPFLQLWTVIQDHGTYRTIIQTHLTCTNKAISGEDNKLFLPPVHNIYGDGRICFGHVSPINNLNNLPATEIPRKLMNLFLGSNFNDEVKVKWPKEFRSFAAMRDGGFNDVDKTYTTNYNPCDRDDVNSIVGYLRGYTN